MSFSVSIGLLVVAGGALSVLSVVCKNVARTLWFRLGGFVLWLGLLLLMGAQVGQPMPHHLILILLSSFFWIPFMVCLVTNTFAGLARSALSLDQMRLPPGYSQAEAAEARRELARALGLYEGTARKHPQEPEPWRRMAEVHLKLGRPDEAIRCFEEAAEREAAASGKMMMLFAIAEAMADGKGDVAGAAEVIERFLAGYPNAEGREFAEERLRRLRERLGKAGRDDDGEEAS